MDSQLSELKAMIVEILGDWASVEELHHEKKSGADFSGLYLEAPGNPCAAPIEVWHGASGWQLSISSVLSMEIAPDAAGGDEQLESLVWATVLGGCGVYRICRRLYFFAGDHTRIAYEFAAAAGTGVAKLLQEWCAWVQRLSDLEATRLACYTSDALIVPLARRWSPAI